jgi:hypothetical protein
MNHIARQIITLAFIAGVAIMATVTVQAAQADTPPPARPAADAQPCADLGGAVGPDQTCQVQIVTTSYEIDFSFPVDYPGQQAVTDYLTQRREDFVDFVTGLPTREFPYALEANTTTYRSGTPTSGTESLVFEVYSDSGGAHPSTGYQSFSYDLGKDVPIALDTLFKPATQPVEVLDPVVGRELEKRWRGYGGPVPPMPENSLGAEMYQNFAITDDAVIFFIGQGQWLSQVDGPQEVSVPRTELTSLLT